MIREALQYVAGLAAQNEKTEVLEICGKTYANKSLTRYDEAEKAAPLMAYSLTALVDYIRARSVEFPSGLDMIIHINGPKNVRLISGLDKERKRESLFEVTVHVSEFDFGKWYDQERFMIDLQANFEKKNNQSYSDDGVSQVATMTVGVAQKADVIVPNPVKLIPYRTFQEVEQPASQFVFRIGDNEVPTFMIVEAQNQIWKNEAVKNIKNFFISALQDMPQDIRERIAIIG